MREALETPTKTARDGDQHITALVTLHWVSVGLGGVAFLILAFFTQAFAGEINPLLPLITFPFIVPHAMSALGLSNRASWAWTTSLVTCIISALLFGFIGIPLLVYGLIALNRADVKSQFQGAPA